MLGGTTFAPLAIGSALMIMVYMGGHVSVDLLQPVLRGAVTDRNRRFVGWTFLLRLKRTEADGPRQKKGDQ